MKRMKTFFLGTLLCANFVVGTQALAGTNIKQVCFWTVCLTSGTGCFVPPNTEL